MKCLVGFLCVLAWLCIIAWHSGTREGTLLALLTKILSKQLLCSVIMNIVGVVRTRTNMSSTLVTPRKEGGVLLRNICTLKIRKNTKL